MFILQHVRCALRSSAQSNVTFIWLHAPSGISTDPHTAQKHLFPSNNAVTLAVVQSCSSLGPLSLSSSFSSLAVKGELFLLAVRPILMSSTKCTMQQQRAQHHTVPRPPHKPLPPTTPLHLTQTLAASRRRWRRRHSARRRNYTYILQPHGQLLNARRSGRRTTRTSLEPFATCALTRKRELVRESLFAEQLDYGRHRRQHLRGESNSPSVSYGAVHIHIHFRVCVFESVLAYSMENWTA